MMFNTMKQQFLRKTIYALLCFHQTGLVHCSLNSRLTKRRQVKYSTSQIWDTSQIFEALIRSLEFGNYYFLKFSLFYLWKIRRKGQKLLVILCHSVSHVRLIKSIRTGKFCPLILNIRYRKQFLINKCWNFSIQMHFPKTDTTFRPNK